MKAVMVRQWGSVENAVIENVEQPQPGPGEVLVRVKAASVNPLDWKIREGYLHEYVTLPYMLGSDFAGDIEALGEGVTGWQVGAPVYGMKGLGGGAYAEFTTVNAQEIGAKPSTLSYSEAASVPHTALTAWTALVTACDVQAGQRVLIHAAAGGVGHFAVQIAKRKGAYVIGTASARHQAFLHSLGVDEWIDYTTIPFETVVSDVDLVLDTVGGDTGDRSLSAIKPGGKMACIVNMPSMEAAAQHQVDVKFIVPQSSTGLLAEIAQQIDAGHLKPHVQQTFDFLQIRDALHLSQVMHVGGKIAVNIVA